MTRSRCGHAIALVLLCLGLAACTGSVSPTLPPTLAPTDTAVSTTALPAPTATLFPTATAAPPPTATATTAPEPTPTSTPEPTATVQPSPIPPTKTAIPPTATVAPPAETPAPPIATQAPAATPTAPTATATGPVPTDDSLLAGMIKIVLEQHDIVASEVRIADGRANGGERICLISWRRPVGETNLKQLLTHLGGMFGVVHAANQTLSADLDSIVVIIANQADAVVAMVAVSTDDVAALISDEITEAEFLARMNVENF